MSQTFHKPGGSELASSQIPTDNDKSYPSAQIPNDLQKSRTQSAMQPLSNFSISLNLLDQQSRPSTQSDAYAYPLIPADEKESSIKSRPTLGTFLLHLEIFDTFTKFRLTRILLKIT